MKRTITQLLLIAFAMPILLIGQSPANLTQDIEWIAGFDGIEDIEEAYNFGRREEEYQMGLPTESLGFLVLPTDWDNYSPSQKALFIINEERIARGGLDYGNGAVLGLPMDALEDNMNNITQNHANWLAANNDFSHTGENGWSPFDRIDNDPVLGNSTNCHEFLTRAENLAGFWSSQSEIPMPIERAIYTWLYKGASNFWGHREAVLLQNEDLSGNAWGYLNNHSSSSSEGFLGVGLVESTNGDWNPFGLGSWVDAGTLVAITVVDPVSSASCDYQKMAAAPAVLPIELVDFYGEKNEGSVDLTWLTAVEEDNAFFSVQFSENGKDFIEIGKVEGQGNSQDEQWYEFTHHQPVSGINYYRLEQFDFDGKSSLSKMIAVRFVENWLVSIYPNPVVGELLTLNLTAEEIQDVEVFIFNAANKLVQKLDLSLEMGFNQKKLETAHFANGFYTMVISNERKREVVRFSKN